MATPCGAGRGNAGRWGGGAEDLYVLTEVEEHPVFERLGDDFVVHRHNCTHGPAHDSRVGKAA